MAKASDAPMVVGLVGHAGSGKYSAAQAMWAHGFVALAFADPLRMEIAAAWGVDDRVLVDRPTKELPCRALAIHRCCDRRFLHWAVFHGHSLWEPRSPRWLMQRWGNEFRRTLDPAYWVRQVEREIGEQCARGRHRFVVPDVRQANEAELVRRLGGRLVRVHRPELPVLAPDTAGHRSESQGALVVDTVIHNDGTLAGLGCEVTRVLGELLQQPDEVMP